MAGDSTYECLAAYPGIRGGRRVAWLGNGWTNWDAVRKSLHLSSWEFCGGTICSSYLFPLFPSFGVYIEPCTLGSLVGIQSLCCSSRNRYWIPPGLSRIQKFDGRDRVPFVVEGFKITGKQDTPQVAPVCQPVIQNTIIFRCSIGIACLVYAYRIRNSRSPSSSRLYASALDTASLSMTCTPPPRVPSAHQPKLHPAGG
jgi:hypothetical protein